MKKSLLTAFLIAMITFGLAFVDYAHLGGAENSLNMANAASLNATPSQAKTPTAIANTSNDIYSTPHSLLVRLPNGTLYTTFNSNLLGSNFNDAVYVTSSNDGGATWKTPIKISNFSQTTTTTTTSSSNGTITTVNPEPNQGTLGTVIATDANNNIYVAWSGFSNDDAVWQIWCSIYNGSAWSSPVKVSRGLEPRLNSQSLSIALDGNNKIHIVWDTSMNGNNTHDYEHNKIFHAEYNGTWSAPILISAHSGVTPFFQFSPCIAVDSKNNLNVVWARSNYPSDEGDLWYVKYNGTWQVPVKLTTSTVPDMHGMYLQAPAIAVDSKDNLHIVYHGGSNSNSRTDEIWYMNYTNSPSRPIIISYVPLMDSSDQQNPSITIDSSDQIHVMWMSARESVLFYSRYSNSSWSTPVQIEGYTSTYPHFAWSTFPSSNTTTKLDYVFSRRPTLMFNSLSLTEPPLGPTYSVSINPTSEIVSVGQSLSLTSTVIAGHSPYKYQWYWYLNDTAVSGATSNSWVFRPDTKGTYSFFVSVTDSDNKTVTSETCYVEATTDFVQGSFGYIALSGEAQGGHSYVAYGSRFTLRVEANITSMSALMSNYPPPSYGNPNFTYSPTFGYRFAIYNDNNNSIGSLIAQTELGTALVGVQYQDLYSTANFPSPVHLNPGVYWLMEVADAQQGQLNINGPQTNDYNESIYGNIGGMTFPTSISPTQQWLGHLYCIYASWEMNGSQTVTQNQNLFAVTSNSTVSSLTYNPTTNQLNFTVSGPNGTTGYADIYISKTLLQNLDELTVLIDGKSMNFTSTSNDKFWILQFAYTHSTHKVNINLSTTISEFPSWIILPALLAIVTLGTATVKRKRVH